MITPLIIACVVEAATGLALLVQPALVVRLLLGAEILGAGTIASRVAGIALISLSIACWPGSASLRGMLVYSTLTTVYLMYLAVGRVWVGPLLWPAVAAHAVLTLLLARVWLTSRQAQEGDTIRPLT